ncbi:hypothetical protein BYT27DRAFT_7263379 [Phlegmacium glaucopus]|nr:hypothetical protein BYT27DRAFT_7263379 [Phlegmacium glaucopus]
MTQKKNQHQKLRNGRLKQCCHLPTLDTTIIHIDDDDDDIYPDPPTTSAPPTTTTNSMLAPHPKSGSISFSHGVLATNALADLINCPQDS